MNERRAVQRREAAGKFSTIATGIGYVIAGLREGEYAGAQGLMRAIYNGTHHFLSSQRTFPMTRDVSARMRGIVAVISDIRDPLVEALQLGKDVKRTIKTRDMYDQLRVLEETARHYAEEQAK